MRIKTRSYMQVVAYAQPGQLAHHVTIGVALEMLRVSHPTWNMRHKLAMLASSDTTRRIDLRGGAALWLLED